MEIEKDFHFEAAHYLPFVPEQHKCHRVHGHSYVATIGAKGPLTPDGWVIDFADVSAAAAGILGELDHRLLNDVAGLQNPTAELLAMWIYERMEPILSGLSFVTVCETATARCTYRGPA